MDDAELLKNGLDDESTDRSDEIITDMISLIHSSTQSSYVTCSKLSLKLISYFSQVHMHDNEWNDLAKAVEVDSFFDSFRAKRLVFPSISLSLAVRSEWRSSRSSSFPQINWNHQHVCQRLRRTELYFGSRCTHPQRKYSSATRLIGKRMSSPVETSFPHQ